MQEQISPLAPERDMGLAAHANRDDSGPAEHASPGGHTSVSLPRPSHQPDSPPAR